MSFPIANHEKFLIPLEEIKSATYEFDCVIEIPLLDNMRSRLYRGELSERWGDCTAAFKRFSNYRGDEKKEFLNELKVISNLNHENIIPFLGYCDEGGEMIIVYEYPFYGNVLQKLLYPEERCLTWQHRLKICMDAGIGLNYLHSGLGHDTVIHGSFMLTNIFFDDNLNAQIAGFQNAELIPRNKSCHQVYKPITYVEKYTPILMDPIYLETGILKIETDIYSFGVLLLVMLTSQRAFGAMWTNDERKPKLLTLMLQQDYHNRLHSLVDPAIRAQIGGPSFRMIEEIICKCLSYDLNDRPTSDTLIKTIKDALDIHTWDVVRKDTYSICLYSQNPETNYFIQGEYRNPNEFYISSNEIDLALETTSKEDLPYLHTAELSERWPNRTVVFKINKAVYHQGSRSNTFYNELKIVHKFHHENIISFLGYCFEGPYEILILEHAINGSLSDHLDDQDKLRCLPWERRLNICLGAARGLRCLHNGLWDEDRFVVHRNVRSKYILLDENMDAKISEFDLSIFVPKIKPQVSDNIWELVPSYEQEFMDPFYKKSNIVNTEIDVYSFGLVMFEILSGVSQRREYCTDEHHLIKRVHRHYCDNEMAKLIDPNIRDQIDGRSFQIFAETAYSCLSYNIKERPSMNRIIKKIEEALYFQKHGAAPITITTRSLQYEKLEDLLIPLKEIKMATCDFSESSKIGKGGFGVVYKGRLSESWTKHEAAFKRLQDKTSDKEKTEFLKELKLISMFHHHNIIRLIGYCDDGNEMILVSKYAINGSLDDHLEDPKKMCLLTWNRRLKICLGAAKGLDYLHSGLGEDNKVIHRDVKSGNILLDENLEAKICDFGLSKSGLTYDHQHTKHYTGVAGTDYYIDPVYHESGILRTESDVYSFGVVMFEMLSGMPAYDKRKIGDDEPRYLINLVRRYYDYGKDLLIDPQIKAQMDKNSFRTFIEIAYQCISLNSKERPTMETVAEKIEEALDFQVRKEASSK